MPTDDFELLDPPPDAGWKWPVFALGTGPRIVILHELNGITDEVVTFASNVAGNGFTVWLPQLAGPARSRSGIDALRAIGRICISREFNTLARGKTSRVVEPLRRLLEYAAGSSGRAGVIGMCFSGGFAMALASKHPVRAAVAAEPAMPFSTARQPKSRRDLGMDTQDISDLRRRLDASQVELFVTRFSDDWISPPERRDSIKEAFPNGVTVDELPSCDGNEFGFRRGLRGDHAVLTAAPFKTHTEGVAHDELMKTADRVVAFMKRRLIDE